MTEMLIPEGRNPSVGAIRKCARAMAYLIEIGWSKEQLPLLEGMWWKLHDDQGRVSGSRSRRRGKEANIDTISAK